ncbi:acyl-CoA N-acyltransferase [Phellopilus nigrolimitatus]|nr:acyl-CoA N-acyltransferase [Phellopilus nigrolimitatus]
MPPPDPSVYIRRVQKEDASALSRICLLTANAGTSAEALHALGELPGLVYALPYVHVPHTAGFVLARRDPGKTEVVVGYLLLALDTRAFETAAERDWYPPLRARYPKPGTEEADSAYKLLLKDADKAIYIHSARAGAGARRHIDILPEYQRQGWGRRLIDTTVSFLRDEKGLEGLWLGMDTRNADAAHFYERLGFKGIDGAPKHCVGLSFDEWS